VNTSMHAPPINATASEGDRGERARLTNDRAYRVPELVQAQWERERDRLLSLYWRTKDARHWCAYIAHVAGMASRL
jgi:hypothetical protein